MTKHLINLAACALLAAALPLALASCGGDKDEDEPVVPLTEEQAWKMLRSYWEITPVISVMPSTERGELYKEQICVKDDRSMDVLQISELLSSGKINTYRFPLYGMSSTPCTMTPAKDGDYSCGTITRKGSGDQVSVIEYKNLTATSCQMRMQGQSAWSKAKKVETEPLKQATRQKIVGWWKAPDTRKPIRDYLDEEVVNITATSITHAYHVKKNAMGAVAQYADKWVQLYRTDSFLYTEYSWDGYPRTFWYYNDFSKKTATTYGYIIRYDDNHVFINSQTDLYTRTSPIEDIIDLTSLHL
ncbi:MAG: hypothetical protein IJ692_07345 [Alloprevotella sp.]|nr:hypothetical protein [Alloprevotella sp.]MBR1652854.1 hypothetical protein [Alloprevotella sp.]MBR1653179.1 hypothetical protein [Alloprevotella sp.]